MQAPKQERVTEEDSEGASGSESGSDAESEEAANAIPAAKAEAQPDARPTVQQAPKTAAAPSARPAPATSKATPKGIRARLQQSAAAAAAAREADMHSGPSASAAEVIIPVLQVASSQPEPILAPSVSPTLPYDSADLGTSPTAFGAALPYDRAELEANAASDLATQQSVLNGNPADSSDRNESAVDPDFFAAAAAVRAGGEDPAASSAPAAAKPNRGASVFMPACHLPVAHVTHAIAS